MVTELRLKNKARGIITIAPEFASPDLVRIFNKTLTRERVYRSVEMCGKHPEFNTVMLYFMIGVPGERKDDRLAIADYAVEIYNRLQREDGVVIVKFLQYMPKPGTVGQRLAMADPISIDDQVEEIENRLQKLVGPDCFERNFRVLWGESQRMHLESICGRGDRRIGAVLESLYDSYPDLTTIGPEQIQGALAVHGLTQSFYLRQMENDILPWEVINNVDPATERALLQSLDARQLAIGD